MGRIRTMWSSQSMINIVSSFHGPLERMEMIKTYLYGIRSYQDRNLRNDHDPLIVTDLEYKKLFYFMAYYYED